MPDLHFRIEGAQVLPYAAVPTLVFKLRVENRDDEPVHAVTLNTQIRIATRQRHYTAAEQERLADLFGEPSRWGATLTSLLWTHTVVLVPPFTGSTVVDMPVTCTYDFEVASSKYFHGLEDGSVPLEFLFRGTIFYAAAYGLQVSQISWEKEARYHLPVSLWKAVMEHYFPKSAWIRFRRDVFDQLASYRSRNGLPTWEAALEQLLPAVEERTS